MQLRTLNRFQVSKSLCKSRNRTAKTKEKVHLFYTKITLLVLAYVVMGTFGYLLVKSDKRAARKNEYRVPERSLVTIGLLCGWPGVFIAMSHFHHKVRKTDFKLTLKVAAILNLALVYGYCSLV